MDAYDPRGHARIQQRDIDAAVRDHGYMAGVFLGALERQRGWQVEAEWKGLLQQVGVQTPTVASLVARLRQMIGAALVRAGERLAGTPRGGATSETVAVAGSLGPVG